MLQQIAGGSGLTPMLQVIQEIARNPDDKTKVSFIFANQSATDIILKKELDDLKANHDNINVSLSKSVPPMLVFPSFSQGSDLVMIAKLRS